MPQFGGHSVPPPRCIKSSANESWVDKGQGKKQRKNSQKAVKDRRRGERAGEKRWQGGPEVMQDLRTKRN